jgi:AraC-like DNA-binding protein
MGLRRSFPDLFEHRSVFETPVVRIFLWRCRRSRPGPGAERAQPRPMIVFLRSGNFRAESSADIGLLDCTRAGFFNAGVPFRSAHPYTPMDSGSDFAVRPDILAEIVSPFRGPAEDPDRPFPAGWGPVDGAAYLRQTVILRKAQSPDETDELEIEELTLGLVARLAAAAFGKAAPARKNGAGRDREMSEALRGLVSACPGARHRLDDLARRFGSTPFRLCRSFRAATGTTIHRHLTDVRLHRAIDRLAGGCEDLSDLAFRLGFSSHSHFTATFRRRLGVTPESVRAIGGRRGLLALRERIASKGAARI